jgi:hypothetical protein
VTNSSYGQEAIPFAKDGIRANVLLPSATHSPKQPRWQGNPDLKRKTAACMALP